MLTEVIQVVCGFGANDSSFTGYTISSGRAFELVNFKGRPSYDHACRLAQSRSIYACCVRSRPMFDSPDGIHIRYQTAYDASDFVADSALFDD